jgi:hypothetical protein
VSDATHLINFNREYVSPNEQGKLAWRDDGAQRGNCSLRCHGENHYQLGYDRSGALKDASGAVRSSRQTRTR